MFPSVANAQILNKSLLVTDIALAGIDLGQTLSCSTQCYETNPLYKNLSKPAFAAVKIATTTTILVLIEKKTTGKTKTLAFLTFGVVQGIVVYHNHSLLTRK